ncbi:GDSL-type esterase/lipase family protein [Leifsonia sp. fls2-241-R2A-40a]|uniref:SGNH/GDSL hydrolase family protein n=1 Tax=Leifsonia sp. fls2-241-R2A-40a TaxID=3040290 RepID=UPI0025506933|nr:GDSL-type esterase/lipase family protein [Leifsonia sp. fls2-241-R2A-40a]
MTARRSPLALLIAALVSVSLVGCTAAAGNPFSTTSTPVPTPTSSQHSVTAAAIGDSIAIGNGVPAEDAWPLLVAQRFGWTLSDFGESAAGFTAKGLNTHIFDDQVSAVIRVHPDVVIVGATRNDVFAPTATLKQAATAALQRLRAALPKAKIIGVSALWGSDATPAQIPVISQTVKAAVLSVGGSWVELGQPFTGHPELVLADHVHPTVQGQKLLADRISRVIAADLAKA